MLVKSSMKYGATRRTILKLAGGGLLGYGLFEAGLTRAAASGSTEIRLAIGDAQVNETLDPARAEITNSHVLVGAIYDHLLRYDGQYHTTPRLAERWELSEDGREWTFFLRSGVRWHDGRPFTAEDVEFSIRRQLDKEVGSDLFTRLAPSIDIAAIRPKGDHEISVGLLRPDALLPHVFGARQFAMVPAGFEPRTTDVAKAIGCGPFKLTSYQPGQGWEAVRNEDYYLGVPSIQRVRVAVIPEQSTKIQAVISGDFDACDAIQPSLARTIEGNDAVKLARLTADRMMCIALDSTQKPFDDDRVRMAIKLAIDRKRLLNISYLGYGEIVQDVPTPPSSPFYPSAVDHSQNIERSKELLAEAGYPEGIDIELGTSESFGGMVDLAVAFAEIVRPAGIRVTVKQHPPATYWDQVWLHAPMYVTYWTNRQVAEVLEVTYGSESKVNESRFKSPELQKLVAEGLGERDESKRNEIFEKALTIVADQSGLIIPFFIDKLWVSRSNVDLSVNSTVSVDLFATKIN